MTAQSDVIGACLKRLDGLVAEGRLDQALQIVCKLALHVARSPLATGVALSSPELDRVCQRIGAITRPSTTAPRPDGPDTEVIYVVTELNAYGGHTRLLEDMIGMQPSRTHRILVTNIDNRASEETVPDFIHALTDKVESAPGDSLLEKLTWLQQRLADSHPLAIILLNHWHDSVAVAAVQPGSGPCFFVHHADHMFCLGVHVSHYRHVDLYPMRFFACRQQLGIRDNLFWVCSVPDAGARSPESFPFPAKPLTTCSSGSDLKFQGVYPFSYFDEVPNILRHTGGTHVHIGPINNRLLRRVKDKLSQLGLDPARFVHVPWVRSVWLAMAEYGVDIYLSSFPVFGGRALIEAMGSGTPVLAHRHMFERFLSDFHLLYPGALIWTRPEELYDVLDKLGADDLRHHGLQGRLWYEAHFKPELLREALERLSSLEPPPEPENTYLDPLAKLLSPGQLGATVSQQLKFADLLDGSGLVEAADACRAEILQLDGVLAAALHAAAQKHSAAGDHAAALPLLLRATAVRPGSPVFHNSLGCALFRAGQTAEAIRHFQEALALKPDFADARTNLDAATNAMQRKTVP